MAVLLRAVGVPTRNVTGFIGGTYNRYGHFYAVRQGDAHSWVEAFVEERGWLTFDPTPPADAAPRSELAGFWANLRDLLEATSQRWEHHVVGYDLQQQVGLLQTLSSRYRRPSSTTAAAWPRARMLVGLGVVLGIGAAGYVWLRRRARRGGPGPEASADRTPSARLATALYEALEAAMVAQGVPRPASTPPLRHAEGLAGIEHPLAEEVTGLTRIYLEARFGGAPIEDGDRRDFERRVKALRAADVRAARPAARTGALHPRGTSVV